jgi:hypothetical protein
MKVNLSSLILPLILFQLLAQLTTSEAQQPTLNDSPPLRARAYVDSASYHVKSKINLTIEINWHTPAIHYRISPPEFKLPNGLEQISVSSSSAGQDILTYHFTLQANKIGDYKLDLIHITCMPPDADKPIPLPLIKGVSFTVVPYAFLGLKSKYWLPVGGGLIIIICLAICTIIYIRKRETGRSADTADKITKLQNQLVICKTYKLEGKTDKFMEAALHAYKLLEDMPPQASLLQLAEKIRFGGYRPSPGEIEQIFRELENKLKPFLAKQNNRIEAEGIKLIPSIHNDKF